MKIRFNEKEIDVGEGARVDDAHRQMKPDADVVIHNGFPAEEGAVLREGDELILIRRGEEPTREELESLLTARHTPGVHARVKQGMSIIILHFPFPLVYETGPECPLHRMVSDESVYMPENSNISRELLHSLRPAMAPLLAILPFD